MSAHVRRYLHEKYQSECVKCGWGEINPTTGKTPLEIDHMDGDSENNREQNLRLLCPNCHSLTSTWKALNKGKGSKKRLRYHGLGR
jgi:Zn finger protein HypA/HybF involved in hydrogenase expression